MRIRRGAAVLVAVLTLVVAGSVIALAWDAPATFAHAASQGGADVNEQGYANQEVADLNQSGVDELGEANQAEDYSVGDH